MKSEYHEYHGGHAIIKPQLGSYFETYKKNTGMLDKYFGQYVYNDNVALFNLNRVPINTANRTPMLYNNKKKRGGGKKRK